MEESIQYFCGVFIKKFIELKGELYKTPDEFSDFIIKLDGELNKLGCQLIKETLEEMDRLISNSNKRKMFWKIESHDNKQLITSLGTVTFSKTLFTKKDEKDEDGHEIMKHLLDIALGLEAGQRMTEDAVAKVYEEAAQTSYRRGGESVNTEDNVTKETVKNVLHETQFPPNFIAPLAKKEVKYLYIDADEDHYHLQFKEHKGDLEISEQGWKLNRGITKIIYVYEGIEPDAPKSRRHHLVNPHYFCREGTEDNDSLWDEVYSYIESTYDVGKIERIYLNSDGGSWIKAGMHRISGIQYVLDEFHLSKYISKLTAHMKDSKEDARIELCETIRDKSRPAFDEIAQRLKDCAESEKTQEKIEKAADYIRANWAAAQRRLRKDGGVVACSAEGHVSHVLSSRMSSRPMGWSRRGAGKMARLREWKYNGGSMLELAKYQKVQLPVAAGAETDPLSLGAMLRSEMDSRTSAERETARYAEAITHSVAPQAMKQYYFYVNSWF